MTEPTIGDNSQKFAKDQLRSVVERIEREETAKAEIAEGIKDIYQEAKSNGWDVKILRKVVAIRKKDPAARAEEETLLETYMAALG